MALNNAGLSAAGNGIATVATYMSLHVTAPDATGSAASAAARRPVTLIVAANGDLSVANVAFTGGAANGLINAAGLWSALTGGTYYGSQAIESGDTAFNAAGEFTVLSIAFDLTSTD